MLLPLLLLLLGLVVGGEWSLPPPPPRQTAFQRQLVEATAARAAAVSANWRPELLKLLDSEEVRGDLKECCPEIATLPAEQLLAMLQDEVQSSELTHNFNPFGAYDLTLQHLQNTTYLYNLWQLSYLFYHDMTAGNIEDTAETQLMGFEPFTGRDPTTGKGVPANYLEASQRPLYTVLNLQRIGLGNPVFGDVGFVLSNRVVHDMVLVLPVDTGMWEYHCNASRTPKPAPACLLPPLNCSVFDMMGRTPGVLTSLDHLLYANHVMFSLTPECTGHSLGRVLARLFATRPTPLLLEDRARAMTYLEVDVAGSVPWPDGVRLVVGNFTAFFGSPQGHALQEFCKRHRRVLSWAVAVVNQTVVRAVPTPNSLRVLDPSTTLGIVNYTGSPEAFSSLWEEVSKERDNATSSQWMMWWASLQSSQTAVVPPRARSCVDPECIGTTVPHGDCVCYH